MATTAEAHPDDNVLEAQDTQPYNEKMTTHNTQANDEKTNCQAQSNSGEITHGAQPNHGTVTQEAQRNDGTVIQEAQPNDGTVTQEAEPNDGTVAQEAQPNDGTVTQEAQPNDGTVTQEAQPNDGTVTQEAQPNDRRVTQEAQPNDRIVTQEAQPNDGTVTQEALPNDREMTLEAHPDDGTDAGQLIHGTQLSEVKMIREVQPKHEKMSYEVNPKFETMSPEAELREEEGFPEPHPHDGVMNPEAMMNPEALPHDMMLNPEILSHDAVTNPGSQRHGAAVTPESQPHGAMTTEVRQETQAHDEMLTAPDGQPHDALMIPETQPHDAMMVEPGQETQPHHEIMSAETHPRDGMMTRDTQPHDAMMIPDTHHQDVWMTTDTQPQDAAMAEETHPRDEMMISETQLYDQPHVGMMPPETQLNNENTESEQPNNVLAIHEEQPNNAHRIPETPLKSAYAVPETRPNNAFTAPSTLPDNALSIVNTQPNNEVTSPETQPSKRRKKKSMVWEHFTIETVSAGCRRACCKQCKQTFAYSTGSKVAGTSHLKRHIAKGTCPALLRNLDNNQLTPYTPRVGGSEPPKRRYRSPSLPYISFDQDRCRHEIARMIIMHDYPLHMVEHPGFITFVQNLQPRFDKVSFNTVQGDCVATYLREKQSLMKFIEGIPGRFCLTLDLWTSNQSLGYVFITGHFIDSEWKLQRRILNVVMEPYPESDNAFGHAVAACISDWSLEGRVFSLTFSHPLNEAGLECLRPLLCIKNPLILNGQFVLGNCIARSLSKMAKDVLAAGRDIIKKIRDSVKYVKTSESHEEKFVELKQQLQVPSEKSLSLDDQTKWNTTYHMLVAASELKEVFSCLDTSDPDYKEAPSMDDWRLVETLCAFLKPLFDAASMLTTTTSPTAITFFHEAWKILSDLTRSVASEDPFVSSVSKPMLEKIDKYWRDCCLVMAIAVVMDPRFKMKLVEFSFTKTFGEDAPTYIKTVDDGIHELFLEYVALPLPLTPTYEEGSGGNGMKDESQGGAVDNGLADFDMYIMETTGQLMKSEMDQYLDESLLPRVHDFDVLGWWRLNKTKYPTLSKMARDILSIPVCSVEHNSIFDTVSKEMDEYKSLLRPETAEALICAKDWFQYGSSEASNAVVKMEM